MPPNPLPDLSITNRTVSVTLICRSPAWARWPSGHVSLVKHCGVVDQGPLSTCISPRGTWPRPTLTDPCNRKGIQLDSSCPVPLYTKPAHHPLRNQCRYSHWSCGINRRPDWAVCLCVWTGFIPGDQAVTGVLQSVTLCRKDRLVFSHQSTSVLRLSKIVVQGLRGHHSNTPLQREIVIISHNQV